MDTGCDEILILCCNSSYPTPIKDVNLEVINTIRNKFSNENNPYIDVGWSDHSRKVSVLLNSVINYNVKLIEFHLDLEGNGYEFNSGHCWLPKQIKKVKKILKEFEKSKEVE